MPISVQLINQIFVATEIVVFNILGLFGNVNFLLIIYRKSQLRTKSSYLQCALSVSHIVCLLFELPNSALLFTGIQLVRNVCFPTISIYIFFICAQAIIMLMLVVDLFIIIYFSSIYRTMSSTKYCAILLTPPFLYASFVVAYGFLKMDDEVILFCNPPLSLHPAVSRFWSMSNVISNSLVLILLFILMTIFHYKGKKQKSNTKRIMKRLKVSVVVFLFSWYMALLGVDLFVTIGFTGDLLAFCQSNMVFFALICYTQSFYVTLWRSSEYRIAFLEIWLPSKLDTKWAIKTQFTTTAASTATS